jgi:drug/metabolite transporter (DMT)-like permease
MGRGQMQNMPRHDPVPPRPRPPSQARLERTARAWARYKTLMSWMAIAAVGAVLLALLYLKSSGGPIPFHMAIATIAGVGLTMLLGTGLMGLVYFSSASGHDDDAAAYRDDRND